MRTILLIEDDPQVATGVARILERNGFRVVPVSDASSAFTELDRRAFDGIMCDVILPGVDGTTFYERLHEKHPQMAARVVFVTGWGKDDKVVKLLQYTGRPVLHKPVDAVDLVKTMRAISVVGEAAP